MLDLSYALCNLLHCSRKMTQDISISKNLAEHYSKLLDVVDKLNELSSFFGKQLKSFEAFKDHMEKMSKESSDEQTR